MILSSRRAGTAFLLALALTASGCAARNAYRQGRSEAKKGNWDLAVARLTKALQKDPDNIPYKLALESARVEASQYHYKEARKQLAAQELDHLPKQHLPPDRTRLPRPRAARAAGDG